MVFYQYLMIVCKYYFFDNFIFSARIKPTSMSRNYCGSQQTNGSKSIAVLSMADVTIKKCGLHLHHLHHLSASGTTQENGTCHHRRQRIFTSRRYELRNIHTVRNTLTFNKLREKTSRYLTDFVLDSICQRCYLMQAFKNCSPNQKNFKAACCLPESSMCFNEDTNITKRAINAL